MLKEELDAAEGNRGRAARVMPDILEIEKILSQLFLRDQIWGFAKVLCQLTHGADVAFLSPFGKVSKLKRLDHSLTQFSHSYAS